MSDFDQENQDENLGAGGPEGNLGDARKPEYPVGKGHPPLYSRFQPGQSGCPSGRPRGRPNNKTIVTRVVNEKVSVRIGNKIRRMSSFEAILQGQVVKAMKGDSRATKMVCDIMQKYGLLTDKEDAIAIRESQHPADKVSPGSAILNSLDASLLSQEEMIELSRLVEIIDTGGDIFALSPEDYERLHQIVHKGRKDATLGKRPSASKTQ
jgi:hypothetical protein